MGKHQARCYLMVSSDLETMEIRTTMMCPPSRDRLRIRVHFGGPFEGMNCRAAS